MTDYFKTIAPGLLEARDSLAKINHRISLLRLVLFVFTAGFVIAAFVRKFSIPLFAAGGISFIVFIIVCAVHQRSKNMQKHLDEKINANNRYLARIEGNFNELTDVGTEFVNHSHPFTSDLDIFGPHSLFALYNISHSVFGRSSFADKLRCKNIETLNKNDILELQRLVKSFSDDVEFLLDYEAVGAVHPIPKLPEALLRLCSRDTRLKGSLKLCWKAFPLLWLVPVALLLFGLTKYVRIAVLAVILINIVTWFLITRLDLSDIFKAGMISKQAKAIKVRVDELLSEEKYKDLFVPSYLDSNFADDLDSLIKACSICGLREQPISALLFNALMPFDLMCADRLFDWSFSHGKVFMKNVEKLGDIESIMCACVPGLVSSAACFPEIREDKNAFFEGQDMTHPLLDPSKAVSNSVTIDSQIALITGSNMSGKTTLIRTVGVMMVLAYTGAMVPSKSVSCSVMRIMTSMRIADSLEENMSTFKAELIRIGSIVDAASSDKPLMFLIDEVFRGTNSQDRTDGAQILLKRLSKPCISGFMTTHDYALCDRAAEQKMEKIVFYHFSEKYEENEIIFDYKLVPGMSHESNAMFLMRLVGIM